MSKLITKEIQTTVNRIVREDEYDIKQYSVSNSSCFYIGSVRVNSVGKNTYLYLEEDLHKEYMLEWRKDVGMILVNCLKHRPEQLYELITDNIRVLLYRISDDEFEKYVNTEFDHLIICDYHYIILRMISIDASYAWKDRIMKEEMPEHIDNDEEDYTYDENTEIESEGYSLFN